MTANNLRTLSLKVCVSEEWVISKKCIYYVKNVQKAWILKCSNVHEIVLMSFLCLSLSINNFDNLDLQTILYVINKEQIKINETY